MIHISLQEKHTTLLNLANLKIKEPYKPPVGAYKLPDGVETVSDEDMAKDTSVGSFYTRPYTLSNDRRATFEVKTAQGDKVTLTYERSGFRSDYLRFEGGYVPGLPIINNSKDTFSMTVEGDLDEQELSDMAAFQEEVISIVEDYLSRRTTDFKDTEDLDMSRYDSLTDYAMALDAASSMSYASGMVKGYWNPSHAANKATLPQPVSDQTTPDLPVPESAAPEQQHTAQTVPESRATYNSQGENLLDNTDPGTGPAVSKLSELGKITKEIFKDVSKSTKNDAISDALKILEKDFSGLIEELMVMLEDPDRAKNYFDSWA